MKKLLILFVMAFTINIAAQESVLLRLNYKKGDSYIMNIKMSQDMGATMSMDMNMKMSQNITSTTGDTYVSQIKITQITMDMSQGGMNMSYDSSKSDDELDASAKTIKAKMEPMLHAVITTKGNSIGEISKITVKPNVPSTSDLTNQFSNVVYPKKPVKVGDIWTMSKTQNGMIMNFTYKVKSITKMNVLLDVSGKISGAGEGTITGGMDIDRAFGIPLKSSFDMKMSVGGQEMTTKVNVEMKKI